jgi:hypothetical protein
MKEMSHQCRPPSRMVKAKTEKKNKKTPTILRVSNPSFSLCRKRRRTPSLSKEQGETKRKTPNSGTGKHNHPQSFWLVQV